VRLAAAVSLAKLGDEKAILPLAKCIVNDSDKNVRSACAIGLGNLVKPTTKSAFKNLAVANLKTAAQNDGSDLVKREANKALTAITGAGTSSGGTSGGTTSGGGGAGIYVNIGPMSSKTGASNDAKLRALMVKTAAKTMSSRAAYMSQAWSGGGTPSKSALAGKGISGFYVDGTLNELKIKTSGSSATISCKVSMLLADFPDKSVFGFLNGGASVTASASQSDQDLASEDCVSAVMEDLIAKKIIPTICTKASCP
jgi:HEAT repeats